MPSFVCIGVPHFIGEKRPARTEVKAIRESGFARQIGAPWLDLAPSPAGDEDPVVTVNRALAAAVKMNNEHVPIIFAADCTSAIGTLKGLNLPDPGVIWFDAHGDFNTPETSPSGFLGGMPLAMLVGRGDQAIMRGVGLAPVAEHRILLTDARDLDPAEGVALRASRLTHLRGVGDLLHAPLPAGPLYIHLDVDVVDIAEMPAMSYPAPGGPSLDTVEAVVRRIGRDGRIAGILVSLWNGELATDNRPLEGTLRLVRALVGEMDRAKK